MANNPYRLRAEWQTFLRRILPDGASEIQIQEMRRAFYAGAESLLRLILVNLEGGSDATQADLRMMDGIEAEMKEFANDIRKGKA